MGGFGLQQHAGQADNFEIEAGADQFKQWSAHFN
jgi:hypothetical protein